MQATYDSWKDDLIIHKSTRSRFFFGIKLHHQHRRSGTQRRIPGIFWPEPSPPAKYLKPVFRQFDRSIDLGSIDLAEHCRKRAYVQLANIITLERDLHRITEKVPTYLIHLSPLENIQALQEQLQKSEYEIFSYLLSFPGYENFDDEDIQLVLWFSQPYKNYCQIVKSLVEILHAGSFLVSTLVWTDFLNPFRWSFHIHRARWKWRNKPSDLGNDDQLRQSFSSL